MKSMWTLSGLTWAEFGTRLLADSGDVLGRAAQLSYYFLLALIPALLFLTTILSYIMGAHSGAGRELFVFLENVMPPSAFELVKSAMRDLRGGTTSGTLSVGLLTVYWGASGGVGAMIESLNTAYNVKETRPWWWTRLLGLASTLGLGVFVVSALILVLYGGRIAEWLAFTFKLGASFWVGWHIAQWPMVIVSILTMTASLYYFLPNLPRRKWVWLTPGSVIGTALWLLVSFGFRTYLYYFDTYSKSYGSLGAVVVLMLWLYLTGAAVLFGGKINSEIERAGERAKNTEPSASAG